MPDPKYFDKVKLLDGTYAEVCDAVARAAAVGSTRFIGVTTTSLTDGQTISSVSIGGSAHTLINGDLVLYGNKEFIWASADGKVHELGDLTGLGALAYKSSATGSFTPQGTVSSPNITVTPTTAKVKEFDTAGSVTAGTANTPTAVTVTPGSANTPTAVTLPTLETTLNGTTLEFALTGGSVTPGVAGTPTAVSVTPGVAGTPTAVTLPTSKETTVMTGASAALATDPVFTGTAGSVTVS